VRLADLKVGYLDPVLISPARVKPRHVCSGQVVVIVGQ
jgi:hypothetical protein